MASRVDAVDKAVHRLAPRREKTPSVGASISLRVTRHQETPGIADFIDHSKEDYLPNLDNSPVEDWPSLDNISGATITHKALRSMAAQAQTLRRDAREQASCEAADA